MQQNPFLRFHRAAEGAAYPALLIISLAALAVIVASIALLAVVQTAWAFALTLVSLGVAMAAVAAAILAAFADSEEPGSRRVGVHLKPGEREGAIPLQRQPAPSRHTPKRKAA